MAFLLAIGESTIQLCAVLAFLAAIAEQMDESFTAKVQAYGTEARQSVCVFYTVFDIVLTTQQRPPSRAGLE